MAFDPTIYPIKSYEMAAIGDSAAVLSPGMAVILTGLSSGTSAPSFYYQIAAASSSDFVYGVVYNASNPTASITNLSPGRIIPLNSGIFPVLLSANGNKNDLIKVRATNGKWEPIVPGEIADARLLENAAAGNLAWATYLGVHPMSASSGITANGFTMPIGIAAGQLLYVSSNDTLSFARANAFATSLVYGVYLSNGLVGIEGEFPVLFDTSLTINAGDCVYLSDLTSGVATNVEPASFGTYSIKIGIVRNTIGYGMGSPLPVKFHVQPLIVE